MHARPTNYWRMMLRSGPVAVIGLLALCDAAWLGAWRTAHAASPTDPVQNLDAVREAVRGFLYSNNGSLASPEHVEVGLVDPRLRLAPCGQSLKLFVPAGGAASGNTTVGVRCLGPSPWLIYVPARVKVYRRVVVTTRGLPRQSIVAGTDIRLERRDVSGLTAGYLEDPAQALGREIRRPLPIGTIIVPDALENPLLVRRGERVTILASAGRFTVQMKGKALMDGASGDHIRVKNISSGRVVEGVVTQSGTIEVGH